MRAFYRALRTLSTVTLFFFSWSFLPLWQVAAFAADPKKVRSADFGVRNEQPKPQTSGERFEKALEAIRENVGRAEKKHERGEDDKAEREHIRTKRTEVYSLDVELKKEFATTEKKLKDAKLPQEILDRHYKFVKHYEDNLKELRANLDAVGQYTADSKQGKDAIRKAKQHLEKTKAPSKHVPLDPNKLPHRMVKGKERAPRLKKEEFERDFPPQKMQKTPRTAGLWDADERGWSQIFNSALRTPHSALKHKPVLLASNAPASDMPLDLPRPLGERTEVRGSLATQHWDNSLPDFAFSDLTPYSALATPNLMVAQATVDLPTAANLMETIEIQFTNEINKVTSLLNNDPVSLYEFVKNSFEYEPYYGSLKGSHQTLFEQAGNDFDQASLLIALYRSIGIPARYVYGTINLPIDKAISWLGAPDAQTAVKLLASNGVPVARNANGAITSIQVEHVWIEAYLSYDNYRGKINSQDLNDRIWIPLDPSFKSHIRNSSGINPYIASNISVDTIFQDYQSQLKGNLPIQEYLSLLKTNIEQTLPDKRYYDLIWTNIIDRKELGLLPNTLEYETLAIGSTFTEVQDSLRHKIRFTTSNGATNLTFEEDLFYTTSLPEIVGKRITISFMPATSLDENITNQYGNIYNTPPYLIQVKPVLKINGLTIATGGPIGMGVQHELYQTIISPGEIVEDVVAFPIVSGAYYAIGLDPQRMPTKTLYWHADKYLQVLSAVTTSTERDNIVGELLHLLLTGYLEQKDIANKFIAETMQFRDIKKTTVAIMGIGLLTSYVFSMPVRCDVGPLAIDVKREISNPVDISGANRSIRDFMILFGMNSSYLESAIFETAFGVEGVSTLKALAFANTAGMPIYKITRENSSVYLPLLNVGEDVMTDIINALSQGKQITVSQSEVQINLWRGLGYIIENPQTGEAAYMISGGLSGGSLTEVIKDCERLLTQYPNTYDISTVIAQVRQLVNERKVKLFNPLGYAWFVESKSGYGMRENPFTHEFKFHDGIDLSVDEGTEVFAVADGIVNLSESSQLGAHIRVTHGLGISTLYAHLSDYKVADGVSVREGDLIALVGTTGSSTGAHLHFSVYIGLGSSIDPKLFINIK